MAGTVKHTQGPWRVERGTTLVWGACNTDDNTSYGMGYPIVECRVSPASQWAATKGPTSDEGEANARLIAAAPDLLAALQACAAALLNLVGEDAIRQTTVLNAWAQAVEAEAVARAAIATATGAP